MKFRKYLLAGLLSLLVGSTAFGQNEMFNFYQAVYENAIRYNDRTEAKSNLYKMITIDPENDSILTSLGYLYFEARQYASNVLVCMDAIALNPQNTAALEMISISYENLGLKDKSLDNYEKLYLQTDDFQVLYKMAFLQYDLKKFRQALTNIDILMKAPEAEEATVFYTINEEEKEFSVKIALMNLKGLVHKGLGEMDLAKQSFEETLKMSPDFVFAQENLDSLDQ